MPVPRDACRGLTSASGGCPSLPQVHRLRRARGKDAGRSAPRRVMDATMVRAGTIELATLAFPAGFIVMITLDNALGRRFTRLHDA